MSAWTQDDVDRINAQRGVKMPAHMPIPKQSKYRNVKTWVGSECFDSKREAEYWMLLKAREALSEISELRRQVKFPLLAPIRFNLEPTSGMAVVSEYVADFVYMQAGTMHIVDAKGAKTRTYLMKKKWLELQDGLIIEEV